MFPKPGISQETNTRKHGLTTDWLPKWFSTRRSFKASTTDSGPNEKKISKWGKIFYPDFIILTLRSKQNDSTKSTKMMNAILDRWKDEKIHYFKSLLFAWESTILNFSLKIFYYTLLIFPTYIPRQERILTLLTKSCYKVFLNGTAVVRCLLMPPQIKGYQTMVAWCKGQSHFHSKIMFCITACLMWDEIPKCLSNPTSKG